MSAGPAPGDWAGFCPYCGHQNAPTYRFCVSCRRRLPNPAESPPPASPTATNPGGTGPGASSVTSEPPPTSDALPPRSVGATEPPSELPTAGRAWYVAPIAVLIVIAVVLAGAELFTTYFAGPAPAGPTALHDVRVDLCDASNGSFCGGNQLDLPRTYHSASYNTSGCATVVGWGVGETLWVNYSASTGVDGVLVPANLTGGPSGWFVDPYNVVHNASVLHALPWSSLNRSGAFAGAISVPSDGRTWCLSWYEPTGSVTIAWASDIAVTYRTP